MQQHPTFVALRRAFVGLILLSTLSTVAVAEILLVKTGSTRLSSVTAANWNTSAYPTLRAALTASRSGDQIWVAAGTYYPDKGPGQTNNDQLSTFVMKEGVAIYGGLWWGGSMALKICCL